MNRRSFFKFLGIGAATVAVAPKMLAQKPQRRGMYAKRLTKKILDERIKEKCESLGLSKSQHGSMSLRSWNQFTKKATISEEDAQEILDSVNMEAVSEMESDWKKSIDKLCERQRIQLERMEKTLKG